MLVGALLAGQSGRMDRAAEREVGQEEGLRVEIDRATGLPWSIDSRREGRERHEVTLFERSALAAFE